MEPTFAKELQKYIVKQVNALRNWLRPDPQDTLIKKIFKGFYKSIAVLILIAVSPVLALLLTIAFIAAF